MNFVFCCDRRLLAALHVAARSVLTRLSATVVRPVFWIFSDDVTEGDVELLRRTLCATGRDYEIRLESVDPKPLGQFPSMGGSLAAYYRLLVPASIDVKRYLYLDVDILCKVDLSAAVAHPLGQSPVALCRESPIERSSDPKVYQDLGEYATGYYFNSGVMLVDVDRWRTLKVTERCLAYLAKAKVDYWDQSAINFVLHGDISSLKENFNFYTNVRCNWPQLKRPICGEGHLLHFVDSPKPWSWCAEWVHTFGPEWWRQYRLTEHYLSGSRPLFSRKLSWKQLVAYKRVLKDRLLFEGYDHNFLTRVKGVSPASTDDGFLSR